MTQVISLLISKQKRNERTNRLDIKSYNAPAFIANRYMTIKVNIYPHNEGQRPIKRHKEPKTKVRNSCATYALQLSSQIAKPLYI